MIPYSKSFLGLGLIFRVHGSPLYRAFCPGLISVGFYVLLHIFTPTNEKDYISHPYGVGVLISSVSFLIVFRANYGYQRYWSACGDVHQMMSKWLDAATHAGAYHMQCEKFNHFKPPNYFVHNDLNKYNFSRNRERENDMKRSNKKEQKALAKIRAHSRSIHIVNGAKGNELSEIVSSSSDDSASVHLLNTHDAAIHDPDYLLSEGRKDGGWGAQFEDKRGTFYDMNHSESWLSDAHKGFASMAGGRTPSLFLQELAHLASLCNAVAFSTLRCDIEDAEAPLDMYTAGQPWPEVDPDALRREKGIWVNFKDILQYLSGNDRTPAMRTAHNASRPLPVIGGVSDNEIAFLQRARGPSAKVTLAWHWLSEFIIREHLAGTLGKVGPPIVSRCFQFLSDGMIYYNHARKIMFIPFPFPHAQISAFFTFTIIFAVPMLMDEFAQELIIGCILTFLTVVCLAGLHEVARELENPYRNVPNEIPLVTLQAMFNESLITLYGGFHPDHYYDPNEYASYGERKKGGLTDTGTFSTAESSARKVTLTPVTNAKKVGKKTSSKPQDSGVSPDSVAELRKLIESQQKELNRLTNMMYELEDNKGKPKKGALDFCSPMLST